jgi:hypothetical protein
VGKLTDANHNTIVIPDLWELIPGNTSGGQGGDPSAIYFTAGLQNAAHGLVGSLTVPAPNPAVAAAWYLYNLFV